MSKFGKLMHYLVMMPGRDSAFETYYGSLVMGRQDGIPSAAEARRDYEPVRKLMDRVIVY